jgi:hypothetical protein
MARVLSDETTLSRQRKSLSRESTVLKRVWFVEAAVAGLLLAAGLVLAVWRGSSGLLWLGAFLAFLAVGHFLKTRENAQQEQHLGAGLKGEAEVAQRLAEDLDNTHYVYNDISVRSGMRKAQIDHLVVCPKGIFLIETKNWRGRIVGEESEKAWLQYRYPDSPARRVANPVLQNQRHVSVLEAVLRSGATPLMAIVPLLVFTARHATLEVPNHRAVMLWKAELTDYIRRYEGAETYPEATVDAVVARLQRFA